MMGPLITAEHRDRVRSYVERRRRRGRPGRGRRLGAAGVGDGFFLGCSLLDDVEPGHAGLRRRDLRARCSASCGSATFDEAVALVNANPYGNGVALFTRDGGAARRFEREVEVGMVGINVPIPVPVAWHSFGGWKASIFGDSPIYGPEGIRFYTRPKVVTSRWPDPASSADRPRLPPRRLSTSRFSTAVSGAPTPETAVEVVGSSPAGAAVGRSAAAGVDQGAAVDLGGLAAGDGVDDLDRLRHLVGGARRLLA